MKQLAPKVIWVIQFSPNKQVSHSELLPDQTSISDHSLSQRVDMYIPAPTGKRQKWMHVTDNIEIEAIEFLQRIQKMCDEIKNNMAKENKNPPPNIPEHPPKNPQNVNKNIKNLEKLVQRFNEIMKRLSKPPPPEV